MFTTVCLASQQHVATFIMCRSYVLEMAAIGTISLGLIAAEERAVPSNKQKESVQAVVVSEIQHMSQMMTPFEFTVSHGKTADRLFATYHYLTTDASRSLNSIKAIRRSILLFMLFVET